MDTDWIADRTRLRELVQQDPSASHACLARQLGRSVSWVRDWRARLRAAPDDERVLQGRSRRPQHSPNRLAVEMEQRIVQARHDLTQQYQRVAGPRLILAHLRDSQPPQPPDKVPTSTRTIWKVLVKYHCLRRPDKVPHQRRQRPAPHDTWEIDFSDVPSAAPQAEGKKQHHVEAFHVVDRGSSLYVDVQTSSHYDAEYALLAMAHTLLLQGMPRCIVCDRDPRFVWGWAADRFPSAFMRFLWCLGVELDVLPARRPDLKPYVERLIRSVNGECLRITKPADAQQALTALLAYRQRYNYQRPHQGDVCHNRPPALAFPALPALPRVPETVDPNAWLQRVDGRRYRRQVNSNGVVTIGRQRYYVGQQWSGQKVLLRLDAPQRQFEVEHKGQVVKILKLRGLYEGEPLAFQDYLGRMCDEARSEWKEYLWKQRLKKAVAIATP